MNNFLAGLLKVAGTLGYASMFITWMWLIVFYMPLLLKILPTSSQLDLQKQSPYVDTYFISPVSIPEPLALVFGLAVGVVVVLAIGAVVWRLPRAITRTGRVISHRSTETLVPLLTKKQTPLKPAAKRRLTARVLLAIKLALCVIPFMLVLPLYWIDLSMPNGARLPFSGVLLLSGLSALSGVLCFTVQAVLAHKLRQRYDTLS